MKRILMAILTLTLICLAGTANAEPKLITLDMKLVLTDTQVKQDGKFQDGDFREQIGDIPNIKEVTLYGREVGRTSDDPGTIGWAPQYGIKMQALDGGVWQCMSPGKPGKYMVKALVTPFEGRPSWTCIPELTVSGEVPLGDGTTIRNNVIVVK